MADIPTTMTGNPVMENNNVFTINTCFTSMLRLLWVQDGVLCGHNNNNNNNNNEFLNRMALQYMRTVIKGVL